MWNIKFNNTRKTSWLPGIWKICSWINIQDSIYRSCIVINKSLVLDGSLHYLQCVTYAANLQFLYCLAWFDTVEFNRLPCPKNEMYDDAVFAIRFPYQLTMFGIRILIWISRLLHAHIAYEIVIKKITTGNLLDAENDLSCRTVVKSNFIR